MDLANKHILIGITGGIAAYKICSLIRNFIKSGAEIKVVATPNSLNFVTKLTLQNLSQNNVYVNEFDIKDWQPEHISLATWADIMIVAPASANTIGKIANGIADNLLTSIACAFAKKIIIAPAMNCNMWNNESVKKNINTLKKRGIEILEPENGFLACGYDGKGRLCSIDKIYNSVITTFKYMNYLTGKRIIITAGGTIEDIDPVRYISNYSSGKMGHSIAEVAYKMGATVTLITTKEFDVPYNVVKVKSAIDMQEAINNHYDSADYIIMAAAVADYRVKNYSPQKIKKSDNDKITLELVKNPDILAQICAKKRENLQNFDKKSPIIVGFCAESENLLNNALNKIEKKGCDFIVANDISRKDIGFNSDENEVIIISKSKDITNIGKSSKNEIAQKILEIVTNHE